MGIFTKSTPQEKELKQIHKQEKRDEKKLDIATVSANALTQAEQKLANEEQHLVAEQRERPTKLESKKLGATESAHRTVANKAEKARDKVADLEEKVTLNHGLAQQEGRAAPAAAGGSANFDPVHGHHTQHDPLNHGLAQQEGRAAPAAAGGSANFDSVHGHHTQHDPHNTRGFAGKDNTAAHSGGVMKGLGDLPPRHDETHRPVGYQEPLATSGPHQTHPASAPTGYSGTTAGTTQHPTVHYGTGSTDHHATGTAGGSMFKGGVPIVGTTGAGHSSSHSTANEPRMVPRHAYQADDTAGDPLTQGVQVHVSPELPNHRPVADATEQHNKRYHVGNIL